MTILCMGTSMCGDQCLNQMITRQLVCFTYGTVFISSKRSITIKTFFFLPFSIPYLYCTVILAPYFFTLRFEAYFVSFSLLYLIFSAKDFQDGRARDMVVALKISEVKLGAKGAV